MSGGIQVKRSYKYLVLAGSTGEFVGQANTLIKILKFLGAERRDLVKTNLGYTLWDKYTIVRQ